MGFICDFCGEQRSMVYCRSDSACLCLSCDQKVHSANALSRRHSRTLLCERCNVQPALVRCTEERVSLCQNCDWTGHGASTAASGHKRQTINCYSGCPSSDELSSLWSFVRDLPSIRESNCEQGLGSMRITENSERTTWDTLDNSASLDTSSVLQADNVADALVGSSSLAELKAMSQSLDQLALPVNTLNKVCYPMSNSGVCDDDLFKEFNMDEVDMNIEDYEELFGLTLNNSEELFQNGGLDSLFGTKDMSAADSNCQGGLLAEGSSVGRPSATQPACSVASGDSIMSSKTEPILCFTSKQAHSGISFSGLTGESSAGDYQDCGASSMLLMGEPPWCPPGAESSVPSTSRSNAVMRYKEKKKTRTFEKTVRYESRKARADVRRRVKGRFVKAGEAYDYDPLSPTRSY
ncbi:zinc finger protein CONSTANS-LIKE 9 [Rhodamnia argentea]|uniref:Zinc finger protein CONSTANS-LIKE 9 n=1 Tax=Rhodamnia argentea TaxID=178133 RepID=A0A8B8QHF6_9MYRT|nr:zinc finger protein CONSTANS-LIKE 9 [Rhodamnia argentea]XP_030546491.1 zinc finger protein CONSTANS-LIKE 9 [Rhodamnia argentea]XP_048139118.1 zinc finger protein CONSTANS-LIKE 9 [Rhodamnia argentea]